MFRRNDNRFRYVILVDIIHPSFETVPATVRFMGSQHDCLFDEIIVRE